MLKLLILTLSINFLNADVSKEFVVDLIKKSSNDNVEIKNVDVIDKQRIKDAEGFYAFFVIIDMQIKDKNLSIKQPDTIVTNGKYMVNMMIDIKKRKPIKQILSPKFNPINYKKINLLYGNENAKHKMVLFSDPQCPFCIDESPFIMDKVKKNPNDIALYYFHLPLDIHPASRTIALAVLAGEKKGYKDILKKTYEADMDIKSADEEKILKFFNKKLGTNITKEDINKPEIIDRLTKDMIVARETFVRGTPTIFFDEVKDNTRTKYEKVIK